LQSFVFFSHDATFHNNANHSCLNPYLDCLGDIVSWSVYEIEKEKIQKLNLSPEEYQKKIMALLRRLKL